MKPFLTQLRDELTAVPERLPLLTLIIAASVLLMPIALLGSGVVDVFVSIAAATFLLRSIVERDFKWLREPWVAVAVVLWIYLVARGLLSVDPQRSGLKALSWIRFIVFGCAIHFVLVRSVTARRALLYSILAMALFGAADALFQFVVGVDVFGREKYSSTRLTGPLQNPAIGFLLAIVGLPATFFLWRQVRAPLGLRLQLSVAALATILLAIFFSGERLALLQVAAATVLVVAILRVRLKAIATMAAIVGAAAFGVLATSNTMLSDRHLSTFTEASKGKKSIYLRTMRSGIEVIKDNPIVGVGLKNFKAHCSASATNEEVGDACRLIHPHQIWLHIIAETGTIGLAGFLAIFVLALSPALRAWQLWGDEPLLGGASIAALLLLAPFVPSGNFFSNWREAVFWFVVLTAAAMGRIVAARKVGDGTLKS
jgi:O-antigen ligase